MAVEIDVIVPLLQINSETKKEHHAACSILQPHSIFQEYSGHFSVPKPLVFRTGVLLLLFLL